MKLSLWRPLVFAMLGVVASFVASLWYSHYRMEKIQAWADDIAFNAEPSIAHLAAARAQLQRIYVAMDLYFEARANDDAAAAARARVEVASVRQAFDTELATYDALPTFPGERELGVGMPPLLRALDEHIAEAFAAPRPPAGLKAEHRVYDTLTQIDDRLEQLSQLNAGHAARESESILLARQRGAHLALGLGATSVGWAILASVLAVLALQRQERLVDEHNRLMAQRADELEAFSARVAHDLKNPLAAMALRLMLAEKRPTPDAIEHLKHIVASMNGVVDGLYQFALGAATAPSSERAEISDVVNEILIESRPAAEAASIRLEADVSPAWVPCSRGALTSIVGNLVRNALRYVVEVPRAEWRVMVRTRTHGDAVRIEVEDNGPGLPAGSEEQVFQPFVRFSTSKQGGLGLGLATVKRIVEASGGAVGVARRDPGTLFWVELPRAGEVLAEAPRPAV
jgi:signal transduction histidine kinase